MKKINWSDEYNSGFCKIDKQHKGLFKLYNSISIKFEKGLKIKKEIKKLVDYGYFHLRLEEIIYAEYEINIDNHIMEHNNFASFVIDLQYKNHEEITLDDIEYLRIWLFNHISKNDVILFNKIKEEKYSYYQRKINKIKIIYIYLKFFLGII